MKSRLTAILLLLSSLLTVSRAETAKFDFIFDHYSTEDGLPHNYICDIIQGSSGYIWICTWYGLSRFDGDRFVNYTLRQGENRIPAHNRFLSVKEDLNGYLWITTLDNRLVRFDPVLEAFISVPDALVDFSDYNAQVTTFHNDSRGDVWVGVRGMGLLRVSPDLSYSRIINSGTDVTGIYESSEGDIFVSSENGLSYIKNDIAYQIHNSQNINSFCEFGSRLYFSDTDALIIIDCPEGETFRTATESGSDTTAEAGSESRGSWTPNGKVSEIAFDRKETGGLTTMSITGENDARTLCLGFGGGAIAAVDTTDMTVRIKHYDMGHVRTLFPDSQGLLWIATDRTGIYSFNPKTGGFRHYEHSRNVPSYYADTLTMVRENAGLTWIKMNNYGFGLYDRDKDEIIPLNNVKEQPDCRFSNGVVCYDIDSDGILWMSTANRGLERVTPISPNVDIIVPPSPLRDPSATEIRSICKDSRGMVWVGTKSEELYRYSPDMTSCERIGEKMGMIYCIKEDSKGNIWVGTKGKGLVKIAFDSKGRRTMRRFTHDPSDKSSISSDDIYSIEQDADGKLWVGTFGGGLSMLESPDKEEFVTVYNNFPNYPLDYAERVRYVSSLPDGQMLVATIGGLLCFDPYSSPRTTKFRFVKDFPAAAMIGNNDVIHVFSGKDRTVYLSTSGGGLYRMMLDGEGIQSVSAVNMASGLSSDMVFSAVEDRNGNIWLATAEGISIVDGQTLKVTNFTRYDGIIPTTFSEATCAALDDGTILFGSFNGIYRIDPASFNFSPEIARLVISGVIVNGQRVPMTGRIEIPHDYSFFRVEFASLNYMVGSGLNYSYKLEGYDKEWLTSSPTHGVTYSHIPPGKYRFVVSVSPEEGSGASQSVGIDIRIRPSLWTSTATRVLLAMIAAGILLLIWRILTGYSRLQSERRIERDLNDAKVRFFTNVSHELRTPLTLIIGGIDDISKTVHEGDRIEYSVSLVQKNANRMMMLVNELLDIRSVVNGKIRLKVSQIDVVELLRQVYDNFKDMAAERHMEMRLTHSVDRLMVWGDAIRLEALVYNLFSNAYKYTPDGGLIEGAIFYREGDPEFTIMVKDSGVGVPKDKQRAIFEPFVRASDTVFKGMGSSGIGLSFAKEITDMHGGRIWVESEGSKGSEFYVRLPIDRDHFTEEVAEFIDTDTVEITSDIYGLSKYRVAPTYPLGAVKVLLVEDNAELRIFLYNNMVNRFEVRDAANGKEALQVLESNWIPDIIVTDYMMPEMDGIELINHIRGDFETSHIPVIMFTAKHETDTHIKAMKYGADGYIAKPFTMELFIARIENLLDRRHELIKFMATTPASGEGGTAGEEGSRGKVKLTPEEVVITDRDEELIKKVQAWLEENISDAEITVDMLAAHVGMGRTSLYNKIKGLTGKSPVELIQDFRMEKATYYLKLGQLSVSEISYKVGFSDPGYFSRTFKKHFGVSPSDYVKNSRS